MTPQDRDRIISAVELALGFPNRDTEALRPRTVAHVAWLPPDAPWGPLERELEALSANFQRFQDKASLRRALVSILEEYSPKRAIIWDHHLLDAIGIKEVLQEKGVHIVGHVDPKEFAKGSEEADVGITATEALISESGSIVIRTGPGMFRSASLLPPVHIAVATCFQRLENVGDLVPLFRTWLEKDGSLPSAIHIITGPSRTADIELTLVLGAHGPRALYILALEEGPFQAETRGEGPNG